MGSKLNKLSTLVLCVPLFTLISVSYGKISFSLLNHTPLKFKLTIQPNSDCGALMSKLSTALFLMPQATLTVNFIDQKGRKISPEKLNTWIKNHYISPISLLTDQVRFHYIKISKNIKKMPKLEQYRQGKWAPAHITIDTKI